MFWADAKGHTVWDENGNDYIDFSSGIFAASVGHGNPRIRKALKEPPFIHCYTHEHYWLEKYREMLCEFTGWECAMMWSAGTEATEAAWKICRIATSRTGIWGLDDAFHGKTLGAQIMAHRINDWRWGGPTDKTGCMIMEPYRAITAEFHSKELIDNVREWKSAHNFMLILDEIQGGFGRTGKLFGYQHYEGLEPDIVCIGKGAFSGFPASAILGPKDLLAEPGMDLSSTHGGNPVACAVGIATIEEFRRLNLIERSRELGELLHKKLADFPVETAGRGLLAGINMKTKGFANKLYEKCLARGLLCVHTDRHTVKIGPPLVITKKALLQGIGILRECVDETVYEAESEA
jgi:4-aminobutyrate aminotransferase/(S)-3-amino-2-methylpropionate transaminase